MNIRIRDRIALAIYSIITMAISACAGAYCVNRYWNGDMPSMRLAIYAACTVVVFLLSICTLRMAFRHRQKKDRNSVTVQNNESGNGEVRVSVQALDALVKQAVVGHTDGVADIKTRIVNHEDSISVKIEMSLNGDVHIPNITMLLQGTIKGFIEEFSGIAVRDVSIIVNTIIPVPPQLSIVEQSKPSVTALEQPPQPLPAEQELTAEPCGTACSEPIMMASVSNEAEETVQLSCDAAEEPQVASTDDALAASAQTATDEDAEASDTSGENDAE